MRLYKCDRCNMIVEHVNEMKYNYSVEWRFWRLYGKTIELCDDCNDEIVKNIERRTKK